MDIDRRPHSDRLDWTGRGYFAFPLPPGERDADLWKPFQDVLENAKRGRFDTVASLVDLYDETDSWILANAYVTLIGDAGPRSVFQRIIRDVYPGLDPIYEVEFGDALGTWGNLSCVPILVDSFHRLKDLDDARSIPEYIDRIVGGPTSPLPSPAEAGSAEQYRARVMERYEETKDRFGTEDVTLMRGERLGVVSVAEEILSTVQGGRLDPFLRRRFEACTGIDCTSFYESGVLQPLAVAATMEVFFERPNLAQYGEGVRWFFDHRIPD